MLVYLFTQHVLMKATKVVLGLTIPLSEDHPSHFFAPSHSDSVSHLHQLTCSFEKICWLHGRQPEGQSYPDLQVVRSEAIFIAKANIRCPGWTRSIGIKLELKPQTELQRTRSSA